MKKKHIEELLDSALEMYEEEMDKKEELQNRIDKAIEYHDNCVNNLLDLDKIDDNEKLAYQVAYEIHKNYFEILRGKE